MMIVTNPSQPDDQVDIEKLIPLLQIALSRDISSQPPESLTDSRKKTQKDIINTLLEKAARAEMLGKEIPAILGDLSFDVMDPCGNTTCLIAVTREQLSSERQELVAKATELVNRGLVEQVGFYIEEDYSIEGIDATLEMAGREFCLNATMSLAALLHECTKPRLNRDWVVRCSGAKDLIRCGCSYLPENDLQVEAVYPVDPVFIELAGEEGILVRLDGIAHFLQRVSKATEINMEKNKTDLLELIARHPDILDQEEAVGFIQYQIDDDGVVIWPTVYVRDTKTLVAEKSCASGTSALTLEMVRQAQKGGDFDSVKWEVGQPSDKWISSRYKLKKDPHPSAAIQMKTVVQIICSSAKI